MALALSLHVPADQPATLKHPEPFSCGNNCGLGLIVGKYAQSNRIGIEHGAPFCRPLKRIQNALLDESHGVKDQACALTRRLSRSNQFEVPPAFVLPQSLALAHGAGFDPLLGLLRRRNGSNAEICHVVSGSVPGRRAGIAKRPAILHRCETKNAPWFPRGVLMRTTPLASLRDATPRLRLEGAPAFLIRFALKKS